MGFNAFSIELLLERDAIKDIQRMGHVHMCGGQGTDKELKKFPRADIEEQAFKEVESIISKQ